MTNSGKQSIYHQLDQLNDQTLQLFVQLASYSNEQLHKKRNGWSIIQVLSHLQMSETVSLAYMQKKKHAGTAMQKVSPWSQLKMLMIKLMLSSKLKFKAPKNLSNPPDHYTLQEMKAFWMTQREKLKGFVDDFPEVLYNRAILKHPIAGPQHLYNTLKFFQYHLLHHQYQINRITEEWND